MPRNVALLLLFAYGSCMEMRETVERMVVVRTTGSDLQPAATGFIYKKESNNPASVIKMEETEVMEHLSKYEQPKSFIAPIPLTAGPFDGKEDENKAASVTSESKVIPVVEVQDEKVDGLADEDDNNIFGEEYASEFGNYKSDFDDYLKSLGYFEGGLYHERGDQEDYGTHKHKKNGHKEDKAYETKHSFENGDAGNYQSKKFETYHVSGEGGTDKKFGDDDFLGRHYAFNHGYKGDGHNFDAGHAKDEEVDRFHKLFDSDQYKKEGGFNDGDGLEGGFHKFGDGHAYYRSGAEGGAHDSRDDEAHFGKDGFYGRITLHGSDSGRVSESDGKPFEHFHSDLGASNERHGKSYGYQIKH